MNDNIPIQTKEIVETKEVSSIRIQKVEVQLFNTATVSVMLCDDKGTPFDFKQVRLTEEQYNSWQEDDQAVVDAVLKNLGMNRLQS
jgi:hypothetical protein